MKNIILSVFVIIVAGACKPGTEESATNNVAGSVQDTVRVASIPEYVDSIKHFIARRDNARIKMKEIKADGYQRERLTRMESRLEELDNKLILLENSSLEDWLEVRDGLDSALNALENDLDSVFLTK